MLTEREGVQLKLHMITIEDLVPSDNLLRKIEAAVDFSFIYDEVRELYCPNNGRPSVDPVILVKFLLIGYLYGIASERQIEEQCRDRNSFRWFLGLDLDERVPDHSTISQLRRRKWGGGDLFKKMFVHVLKLCAQAGLVSGKLLITDSTHVKANAAKVSKITVEVERETAEFFERLDAYEAVERECLGMPEITRKPPEQRKTQQTRSTTDPDAGWLKRPDKPEGFHYLSHQTFDAENGIIVDVDVTAGNVPDNKPYTAGIDRTIKTLEALNIEVMAVCADGAYDTALIHKEMEDRELIVYFPKKDTSDHSKAEYKRNDFIYNQDTDEFVCPGGKVLKLRCLQRLETGVFREYGTVPKDCRDCTNREKCLAPSQKSRKIQVNIFQSIVDKHHASDGSDEYNSALRKRQVWCEGTFAAQKARHNLRGLFRRGLKAAEEHCLLSATAINLKRMVKCLG